MVGLLIPGYFNDVWRFDLKNATWDHLWGNLSLNVLADYILPYPGGMNRHAMVLNGNSSSFIVFGGLGYAGSDALGLSAYVYSF